MQPLNVFPMTWTPCPDDFDPAWSPTSIRYCAARFGAALPPPGPGYAYCDIGAGAGAHVAALACLYPEASFWAVEANPTAALQAGRLMSATQRANMTVAPLDLERFLEAATPAFDCMVVRAGYCTLSQQERELVAEMAARKLKCGGALVLAYEALPMAAPFQTLVGVLRSCWNAVAGSEEQRLGRVLDIMERLLGEGRGLFAQGQPVAAACRMLLDMDRRILLHRYLAPYYEPVWFCELGDALARRGLIFRGSLDLTSRLAQTGLAQETGQLLEEVGVLSLQETLRDCLTGTFLRRDTFVRGHNPLADANDVLQQTPFSADMHEGDYAEVCRSARGEIRLDMSAHSRVLDSILSQGACTAGQLAAELGMSHEQVDGVCALRLAMGDLVTAPQAPDRAAVAACNMHLARRAVTDNAMATLVSPLGGCVLLNPVCALFLLAIASGCSPLDHALQAIDPQRAAGSEEEAVRLEQMVLRQYEEFAMHTLPELQRLQIVAAEQADTGLGSSMAGRDGLSDPGESDDSGNRS